MALREPVSVVSLQRLVFILLLVLFMVAICICVPSRQELTGCFREVFRKARVVICRHGRTGKTMALSQSAKGLLTQRYQRITMVVSSCTVVVDLVQLATFAVVAVPACKVGGQGKVGLTLAAVRATEILVMLGYLIATRRGRCKRESMRPVYLAVLSKHVLQLVSTLTAREHSLLNDSRLYTELVWRTVFALCASPTWALLANVSYSAMLCGLYLGLMPSDDLVSLGYQRNDFTVCATWIKAEDLAQYVENLRLHISYLTGFSNRQGLVEFATLQLTTAEGLLGGKRSFQRLLVEEVIVILAISVIVVMIRRCLVEEVMNSLRLHSSEDLVGAFSNILSRLCDCVVHLDDELRICRPAPALAALTNRKVTGEALKGDRLHKHLATDDCERFEAELKKYSDEERDFSEGQDTICVCLQDAYGVLVSCHAFVTSYRDLHGVPHMLLGLNERSERERPEIQGSHMSLATQVAFAADCESSADDNDKGGDARGVDLASNMDGGSGGEVQTNEVPVQLDFDAETLEVKASSRGFDDFLGCPASGLVLADLLEEADFFRIWLRKQLSTMAEGTNGPPFKADVGPFVVQWPQQSVRRGTTPQKVCLTLDFLPHGDDKRKTTGSLPGSYLVSATVTKRKPQTLVPVNSNRHPAAAAKSKIFLSRNTQSCGKEAQARPTLTGTPRSLSSDRLAKERPKARPDVVAI